MIIDINGGNPRRSQIGVAFEPSGHVGDVVFLIVCESVDCAGLLVGQQLIRGIVIPIGIVDLEQSPDRAVGLIPSPFCMPCEDNIRIRLAILAGVVESEVVGGVSREHQHRRAALCPRFEIIRHVHQLHTKLGRRVSGREAVASIRPARRGGHHVPPAVVGPYLDSRDGRLSGIPGSVEIEIAIDRSGDICGGDGPQHRHRDNHLSEKTRE